MFAAREMKNADQSSSVKRQVIQNSVEQSRQLENHPRSTGFSQRYIGNSNLQSLTAGNQSFEQNSPTSGIRMIQRECACGGSCPSCALKEKDGNKIQTKLTVGPANDVYEQEADRVADQIMRMPESSGKDVDERSNTEVHIQRIPSIISGTQDSYSDLKLNQSGGRPLSDSTREFMEPRFGVDFGRVRMHTGQDAQQSASQIQARAFTYGNHVWLGKGAKETDKGLIAHELTHVVQQGSAGSKKEKSATTDNNNGHSKIQRETKQQCPNGVKAITVDLLSLRESNRNPADDLDFANTVFRPCCVQFQLGTGVSVQASDSDTWLGGDTVLDRSTSCGTISSEDKTMNDETAALYGINSRFRAFYVESMNPGARGASLPPFCATGAAAPYVNTARIANIAASRSLAHEFGHILLDSGSHTGIDNRADTSNLMIPTNTSTGESLDATQCATIFRNT